jgi:hypothetical protein
MKELPKFFTSKNGITYTYRKAIKRYNKIIGWGLYNDWLGTLGGAKFMGYLWCTKTGNA